MSSYGSWRSEESCSAVLELLERVTVLHKHLEAKESQAEMDMDQVRAAHLRPPSCECVLSGRAHTGGSLD